MNTTEQLNIDEKELLDIVHEVHLGCFRLCKVVIGNYLPIAGNMGVFCQSQDDFERFTRVREELTESCDNPNQKYYRLRRPIVIPSTDDLPETSYTYLYIRKPAEDTPELGDVDFILPYDEFVLLKNRVANGENVSGASIYSRPGWDMVELKNPSVRAVAYISYQEMAEKVRVRFD